MSRATEATVEGLIFDVDTFAVHDGPGIRMAVYLKGCPLACRWCHSPEGQRAEPELILLRDRCLACGRCAAVCAEGVHVLNGERHAFDPAPCRLCRECVLHCPSHALRVKGRRVEADEVVRRAARMRPFFEHTGGGVTLSGGEVTCQPSFARAVLEGCRRQGIHTAVETCGACEWGTLEPLAALADLVLYDLKLIDEEQHREWTGVSNRRILRNARRLRGHHVEVRVPLIPGLTDTDENLRGLFEFVAEAGLRRLALLPYNEAAGAKYEWLGRDYELQGEVQDEARLEHILRMARDAGLRPRLES